MRTSGVTDSMPGYVVLRTNDREAMIACHSGSLEFARIEQDHGHGYLTTGFDHHSVVIGRPDPAPRTRLGLQIDGHLADPRPALSASGTRKEALNEHR